MKDCQVCHFLQKPCSGTMGGCDYFIHMDVLAKAKGQLTDLSSATKELRTLLEEWSGRSVMELEWSVHSDRIEITARTIRKVGQE